MSASAKGPDWATGKPVYINRPEERVRQEYERLLHFDYGYHRGHMDIEVIIRRGTTARERADLVVYETRDPSKRHQNRHIWGIVETKRVDRKDGVEQLTTYMSATSATWGVWTNGQEIEFLYKNPATGQISTDVIFQVPQYGEPISSIGSHTYEQLKPATNLKLTFRRLLNELYTNTNISRREKLGNEMIKLLFCKLHDEQFDIKWPIPRFRVGLADHEDGYNRVRKRLDDLFEEVKEDLVSEGVFDEHETILLENRSLAYVVGELQGYSLLLTPTDTVGDAFEVFAESRFVGEKGEFFTPRTIVDTAIRIIDPQPGETIMDPACGSGGFLISALQHVWQGMEAQPRWSGLDAGRFAAEKRKLARETVYGIDKENDLVKITKAYMAIIGDGKSRIVQANSLHHPADFDGRASSMLVTDDDQFKQFDVVLTNPPFGSKSTKVALSDSKHFDLGHKWAKRDGTYYKTDQPKRTPAQELFIERCLDLLKPGGRMAIVLPETVAHAPSKKYIIQYLESRATVLAVLDLPHNSFRPHCNAKTLMWILRKDSRTTEPVTFGVAEEMGRDHQGKAKYRLEDGRITDRVWDDMHRIRDEWHQPNDPENANVFTVQRADIANSIYVPRYYWKTPTREIKEVAEDKGYNLVPVSQLIDDGVLQWFRGHGSPPNQFKGLGNVPYVRAGDIGNWAIYKNPTAFIPEDVYRTVKGNKEGLRAKDLIFVKEGSYRIGDVAFVLPTDTNILLNSHCLVFRINEEADNEHGIDSLYLAYLLTHPITRQQLYSKVFIDTTLPNIGDRWVDLLLPVSREVAERDRIREQMEAIYQNRWESEQMIANLMSGAEL